MEPIDSHAAKSAVRQGLLEELHQICTEVRDLRHTIEGLEARLVAAVSSLEEGQADSDGMRGDFDIDESHDVLGHLTAIEWLRLNGISVRHEGPPEYDYSALDHLTRLIGEHREEVRRLYDTIRAALSDNGRIRVDLSKARQEELSYSTQMCTIMRDHALLEHYRYSRGQRLVLGTVLREGYIINYLTGKWFERFVQLKVTALLQAHSLQADLLVNPKIVLPNGDDFELDLFWTVESQPLWIECKTGDYQQHVAKYSKSRKLLNVPSERSVLVVYGLDDRLCESLTKLHGIRITNEVALAGVVAGCLGLSP